MNYFERAICAEKTSTILIKTVMSTQSMVERLNILILLFSTKKMPLKNLFIFLLSTQMAFEMNNLQLGWLWKRFLRGNWPESSEEFLPGLKKG